jgi:hypothetical protein
MQRTMEDRITKHASGAYAYDYDAIPSLAMQKARVRPVCLRCEGQTRTRRKPLSATSR